MEVPLCLLTFDSASMLPVQHPSRLALAEVKLVAPYEPLLDDPQALPTVKALDYDSTCKFKPLRNLNRAG